MTSTPGGVTRAAIRPPRAVLIPTLAHEEQVVGIPAEARAEVRALLAEPRLLDAIQAFRDVVGREPSMLDVWVQLGHALMRAGRHREAIEAFKRAVALDPGAAGSVLAIATAELRTGNLDAAATNAEAVAARDAARAREALARVALARGQAAEAMVQARLAQAADPTLPLPGYIEGALHHARGDYAAAIAPLRRAVAQADARQVTLRDLRPSNRGYPVRAEGGRGVVGVDAVQGSRRLEQFRPLRLGVAVDILEDYLLKPFDQARFRQTLDRVRTELAHQESDALARRVLAMATGFRAERPAPTDRLVVKTAGRVSFLRTREIDWIEAAGNYLKLHVGPESHLVRQTMSVMEEQLDPSTFVRIHRSQIVNIDRIKEMHPLFNGEYGVVLRSGARLTLSRGYRDKLQSRLGGSI